MPPDGEEPVLPVRRGGTWRKSKFWKSLEISFFGARVFDTDMYDSNDICFQHFLYIDTAHSIFQHFLFWLCVVHGFILRGVARKRGTGWCRTRTSP